MKKIFYLMLIALIVLNSCSENESTQQNPQTVQQIVRNDSIEKQLSEVDYPVHVQLFKFNGMNYLIGSSWSQPSGVYIRSISLDSIQFEYYKKQLKLF